MRSNAIEFALRCLRRFFYVGGAQQATVLSAQAFTSLIPFLVVASAFSPSGADLAQRIIERFGLRDHVVLDRHPDHLRALLRPRAAAPVPARLRRRVAGPHRHLARAWVAGRIRGLGHARLTAARVLKDVDGFVFAVIVPTSTGCLLWLLTPMVLLGRRDWRRLVPGAAVSGLLGALLGVASSIYVPVLMDWSAEKYGLIGIAFALQSWLLVFAFVVVIGAVVGATVVELIGESSPRRLRERVR